jgi:hypothetical protein
VKLASAAIVALLALSGAFAAAGCARPDPAPRVPAATTLADAVGKLTRDSLRFTTTTPQHVTATGTVAAGGDRSEMTVTVRKAAPMTVRRIGADVWTRMADAKWDHLAPGVAPSDSAYSPEASDPLTVAREAAAGTDIRRLGDHTYTGVLEGASFTATTDDGGRLVDIEVRDMLTTKYSDFGTAVTIEPPPAAQVHEIR